MLNVLADLARQAGGFILHTAYRTDDHWRVIEVWQSKAAANQFFARHVAPHPAGGSPQTVDSRGPQPRHGRCADDGLMLALRWKTLSGSQAALMRASRWYLSSP